jgi:hypothetical protein
MVDYDGSCAKRFYELTLPDKVPDVLIIAQAQTQDVNRGCQGLDAVMAEVPHCRYSVVGLGAPRPDVKCEASVGNRLGHGSTLIAQSYKANF